MVNKGIEKSYRPIHRSCDSIPKGIGIKRFESSANSIAEGELLHSDDYYIFGIIDSGSCELQVDFTTITLKDGDAIIETPGKLHRFISTNAASGYAIMIDCSLVDDQQSRKLISFARKETLVKPNIQIRSILITLFSMLNTENSHSVELSNLFRVNIGLAIVELFCRMLTVTHQQDEENRYVRHTEAFFTILAGNIIKNRQPSFYAEKMNISPIYLNEAVKVVTGKSVSQNINEEIILRAKRMLAFSKLDISEIAFQLGFKDNAYFTRLFTKIAGCPLTIFRKNLK